MHLITSLLLPWVLAQPAVAVDQSAEAEARAKAVAPYLDAQTLALAHVDLTQMNRDALVTLLTGTEKPAAEGATAFRQAVRQWVADFTKAGGKDVFAVVSAADLPGPTFWIVPLGEGADVDALGRLWAGKAAPGPLTSVETVEKLDGVLFIGSRATLTRLRAGKPAQRPEVADAFAAAGNTAAQVLLLPTADARRLTEEAIPTLPRELGGGPSTVLTQGLQWVALGLDGPPRGSLRLVIQSQDAAAAKALHALIGRALGLLARDKGVWEFLQGAKLTDALVPAVNNNQLTLTLEAGHPGVDKLFALAGVAVDQGLGRLRAAADLGRLGLALHNYYEVHQHFPTVANFDKDGKPLLSWRVHLLPFLGEPALYKEFHLDEPWDSEHNQKLIARMPAVYRRANLRLGLEGKTTYLAPVGKDLMFTGTAQEVQFKDVTDGTSNTILLVDADEGHAVVWTRPADLKVDPQQPLTGLAGHQGGGFNAVFADGGVRFLSKKMDRSTLYALFTRNGGEVVSLP